MKLTGEAIEISDKPGMNLLGIAQYKETHLLNASSKKLTRSNIDFKSYKYESSSSGSKLDKNHSHFILVETDNDTKNWGGEIKFRSDLENKFKEKNQKKSSSIYIVIGNKLKLN